MRISRPGICALIGAGMVTLALSPATAQAGFFDSLTGSRLYRACRAMDGSTSGCECAEAYIREFVDEAYLPIIEAHVTRDYAERNRLNRALGAWTKLSFAAQLLAVGTAGVAQCDGAHLFLTDAAWAGG